VAILFSFFILPQKCDNSFCLIQDCHKFVTKNFFKFILSQNRDNFLKNIFLSQVFSRFLKQQNHLVDDGFVVGSFEISSKMLVVV